MAKKKHYLCAYETARHYNNAVHSVHIECTEYIVGTKPTTSGKQGRKHYGNCQTI